MAHRLDEVVNRRLLTAFFMGAASGLPLLITISLMQAWAKESGVSLSGIGMMALVGVPYTLKFLWAPLFDRFTLPLLGFGRRKGWMLVTQIGVIMSIVAMGMTNPSQGITLFVAAAFLITFFSASQDIVIDAYRREDLREQELGLGSSYYYYGYRLGMLFVSGGGLVLADHISWQQVFFVMAAAMIPGVVMTFLCQEPLHEAGQPHSWRESVIEPFRDYFRKDSAVMILVFILFYKVGDSMASALTTPFFLEIGFSKSQIGVIVKIFGTSAIMIGGFLGGLFMLKQGITKALWLFGFLQMISTAGFAILAQTGPQEAILAAVISFENLASGMGTAAFAAFMASLTNKKFTATQYALLTSLMGVPRVILASSTGFLAEAMGWFWFFGFCTLIALPGMVLLSRFAPWPSAKTCDSDGKPLDYRSSLSRLRRTITEDRT